MRYGTAGGHRARGGLGRLAGPHCAGTSIRQRLLRQTLGQHSRHQHQFGPSEHHSRSLGPAARRGAGFDPSSGSEPIPTDGSSPERSAPRTSAQPTPPSAPFRPREAATPGIQFAASTFSSLSVGFRPGGGSTPGVHSGPSLHTACNSDRCRPHGRHGRSVQQHGICRRRHDHLHRDDHQQFHVQRGDP